MPSLLAPMLAVFALCSLSTQPLYGGGMYIESCNLGCNSGAGGTQVSGQIVNVFENQEVRVTFSQAVNLTTVHSASFRIIDVTTGIQAPGNYSLDLLDPRTVVFRPSLTFGPGGSPEHGFAANTPYQIHVGGTAQGDPGPFVQSTSGVPNESRLQHTVISDQGAQIPILVSCETSPNSVGTGALLDTTGSNSLSANNLTLLVDSAPGQAPGVFFAGTEPRMLPMGQGVRCTGGRLLRLSARTTDMDGNAQHSVDLIRLAPTPGDSRFFQFWYRDTAGTGTSTSNLSNAISVLFYP